MKNCIHGEYGPEIQAADLHSFCNWPKTLFLPDFPLSPPPYLPEPGLADYRKR